MKQSETIGENTEKLSSLQMDAEALPWRQPISLSVSVMLEGWTDQGAPGIGPMGNPLRSGVLDRQARSWAAYGPNQGAQNILKVFADFGIKAVFYVSGIVAEQHPELVGAVAQAGHAVAAHGWAQDVMPAYRAEAEERDDLRRSVAALQQATSMRPQGYMSPRCTPSASTASLLAEEDFLWTADVFDRDLPGRLEADSNLVGMPFTTVVNDMPLSIRYGDIPQDYTASLERILLNWRAAQLGSCCLDLTVHSHVFGRPHGIIELRSALESARGSSEVRLTNHLELAQLCRQWLQGLPAE